MGDGGHERGIQITMRYSFHRKVMIVYFRVMGPTHYYINIMYNMVFQIYDIHPVGSIHCYINIMFVVFESYGIHLFDQRHISSVSELWDQPIVL